MKAFDLENNLPDRDGRVEDRFAQRTFPSERDEHDRIGPRRFGCVRIRSGSLVVPDSLAIVSEFVDARRNSSVDQRIEFAAEEKRRIRSRRTRNDRQTRRRNASFRPRRDASRATRSARLRQTSTGATGRIVQRVSADIRRRAEQMEIERIGEITQTDRSARARRSRTFGPSNQRGERGGERAASGSPAFGYGQRLRANENDQRTTSSERESSTGC